jgi:quercetin dioxygenase-like cupin family protein
MEAAKLESMVKGWFVGAFQPTAYSTEACEIAVKKYLAGEYEAAHYHKVATEITVVISGAVLMCGQKWGAGDIIKLAPGEITDFQALTDTETVVVKIPGALNDKYTVS